MPLRSAPTLPVRALAPVAWLVLFGLLSGAAEAAPVARAGRPFLAYPGETIVLDGSESDGEGLSWRWVQVGGPEVGLRGGDTARPRFLVEAPGRYTFELVVREGEASSEADVVDVIVIDADVAGKVGGAGCAHAGARGLGVVAAIAGVLGLLRRRRA